MSNVRFAAMLAAVALFVGISVGQVGISGDGIPDVYYFANSGSVLTSMGTISRPAGTLVLDTDGIDMVALLVGGPNVSLAGCLLCDDEDLPGIDIVANVGTYTVGFANGATQWVRTAPLQALGFRGVVGTGYIDGGGATQSWPAVDFPQDGLADYGGGLMDSDFVKVFDDGAGTFRSVRWATDAGATGVTDVSVVVGASCDLDGDGDCDINDLDDLYDDISAGTAANDDIATWLTDAGTENGKTYLPGDADLDGNVGGSDFTSLASSFGNTGLAGQPNDSAYWGNGNFNGNVGGPFAVGGSDFTSLAVNFGFVSVSAVPEPGAIAMLMLGMLVLGTVRRNK